MDVREAAQAAPEAQAKAQAPINQEQQQLASGVTAQEADAIDLDEWSLVNEQAEIVASVSTRSEHEDAQAPAEHSAEQEHEEQPATRVVEPASEEQQLAQPQDAGQDVAASESGDREPVESAPVVDEAADTGSSETNFAVPEGCLRIRLRVGIGSPLTPMIRVCVHDFVGEQVRPAWCRATQIVDDFVAEFFADAIAEGKKIRLIYMGMLLIRDRSMGEYGIEEDGVIHCVITEAPSTPHRNAAQQSLELKGFSNPANMLLIITGVGLYGLWTLLYHFPHVFSWKSIVLLSLFSAAHMSAMVSRFSSPLASS